LQFPTPAVADFRQEILKIDHSFNDKFSVFYRFQNDKIPTIDANAIFTSGSSIPFVSTTTTNSPGRTHTAQGTYAITPNLIVEGRYTFRLRSDFKRKHKSFIAAKHNHLVAARLSEYA
jgi:hypothetical protein